MKRFTMLACSGALALVPFLTAAPAHAAPAAAAPAAVHIAAPAAAQPVGTKPAGASRATLATRQAAAFQLASALAAQAPYLGWQAKAKNADVVARALALPGVSTQSRAMAVGRTQIGTFYRWGGTTPAGFDCSGFTRFAYAKAGKKLPRTAAAQQRAAHRVTSPRVGDLVFFGGPAHHVGLYAGNGKVLHSPRTGKRIQVAPIWTSVTYGRP